MINLSCKTFIEHCTFISFYKETIIVFNREARKFQKLDKDNTVLWESDYHQYLECHPCVYNNYLIVGNGDGEVENRYYKSIFIDLDTNMISHEINDVLYVLRINSDSIYFSGGTSATMGNLYKYNSLTQKVEHFRDNCRGRRFWDEKYFICVNFRGDNLVTCFDPVTGMDRWQIDYSDAEYSYITTFKTHGTKWHNIGDEVWLSFADQSVAAINLITGKLVMYINSKEFITPYSTWTFDKDRMKYFKYNSGKIDEIDIKTRAITSYEKVGMKQYDEINLDNSVHFKNYFIFAPLKPSDRLIVYNKESREIEMEYDLLTSFNLPPDRVLLGLSLEDDYLIINLFIGDYNRTCIFNLENLENTKS